MSLREAVFSRVGQASVLVGILLLVVFAPRSRSRTRAGWRDIRVSRVPLD
jgi:hypothetical protein